MKLQQLVNRHHEYKMGRHKHNYVSCPYGTSGTGGQEYDRD